MDYSLLHSSFFVHKLQDLLNTNTHLPTEETLALPSSESTDLKNGTKQVSSEEDKMMGEVDSKDREETMQRAGEVQMQNEGEAKQGQRQEQHQKEPPNDLIDPLEAIRAQLLQSNILAQIMQEQNSLASSPQHKKLQEQTTEQKVPKTNHKAKGKAKSGTVSKQKQPKQKIAETIVQPKQNKKTKQSVHPHASRQSLSPTTHSSSKAKANKSIKAQNKGKASQPEGRRFRRVNFQIEIVEDPSIIASYNKPANSSPPSKRSSLRPVQFDIEVPLVPVKAKASKAVDHEKAETQRLNKLVQERQEEADEQESKPINLGTCSLLEIVQLLKDQGVLDEATFESFASKHTHYDIQDFLRLFTEGKLQKFNFKAAPFTLLDHRRLGELAVSLFPNKYYIGKVAAINKDVHNFLLSLYELAPKPYFDLYKTIDKISHIKWWDILIYKHRLQISKSIKLMRCKLPISPPTNTPNKTAKK